MINPQLSGATAWPKWKLYAFRFCFLYFLVYIILVPNNEMPVVNWVYEQFNNFLHLFVPLFAEKVLHLKNPITIFTNSSGDTTYDFVLLLIGLIITVYLFVWWNYFDRKVKSYDKALYWFTAILRYYLIYSLILYGLTKMFLLQFNNASQFSSLMDRKLGDKSAMGIAWTFIGYSDGYQFFAGLMEFIPGILLLFRRTMLVGALFAFCVMLNVFMMNLCYDIPVKLLSLHCVLMCLALIVVHWQCLANFFLRTQTAQLHQFGFPYTSKKARIAHHVVKWGFVAFLLIFNIKDSWEGYRTTRLAPKTKLDGLHRVKHYVQNGDTLDKITDTTRWDKMTCRSINNTVGVYYLNTSKVDFYNYKFDSVKNILELIGTVDTMDIIRFNCRFDSSILLLSGQIKGDSVQMQLHLVKPETYRLNQTSKFKWVNEFPNNR